MENPQLRQAIESARLGFYDQARIVLLQIIREDPNNELAWLWLAQTLDDPARQRDCLQQVLRINPDNADALLGAEALHTGRPLPEPQTDALLAFDQSSGFAAVDEPEPEPDPDADLYALLDESYYSDVLYDEEPAAAPSVEEDVPFETLAGMPAMNLLDDVEQDEVLEPSTIFEITEPEPEAAPISEPESFLERARRARIEAAPPSVAPFYAEDSEVVESAAAAPDEGEAAVEAAVMKHRGGLFKRSAARQAPDAGVSLLGDVAPAPVKFRAFDRRVLLGLLSFVEIPVIVALLFLLLRGGDGPLAGITSEKALRPSSAVCRELDLEAFAVLDTLGGELAADTAFTGTEVLVTETIVVPAERRLAIYPGATLVFTPGATIEVYGALYACGSSAAPVVFTAEEKTPGGWEGIRLYNPATESVLSDAVIDYAGARALLLHNSPVVLSRVKIAHSARFPISLDGNRVPDLSRGVNLADNPFHGVEIRPGTLTAASAAWQDYGFPYVVTGLVRVDESATLDIKPGVVVKFWREPQGQLSGLWVRGLLKAEDARFTSIHDSGEDAGGATYLEAVNPQPGDWGSITFFQSSAKSYLRNVTVRYGGKSTSAVSVRKSSPELTGITIADSATYPLSTDVNAFPELRDITLSDNVMGDVVEVRGGEAVPERGEFVWHALGGETPVVRVIRDVLVIGPEATLTIDPGVIVKFGEEGQLVIRGALSASGGGGVERIVFTSVRDDDYGGDTDGNTSQRDSRYWGGIVFDGADPQSVLHSTLVRYAPVTVLSASPKLTGNEIADVPGAGLRLSPDSAPELALNRFDTNELNGIAILTGTISSDVQWGRISGAREQVVRVLEGEVTVAARAGLVVEPGTIIKAGPAGKLTVLGDLRAVGLGTQAVIFTALSDDTVGGNTDNRLLEPAPGDWLGVEFGPDANVRLGNLAISYAQYGLTLLGDEFPVVDEGNVHIFNGVNALRCEARMEVPVEFIIENNVVDTARCPAE